MSIVATIILFSGYAVFFPGNFTATNFLTYYINLPIFAALYIFFKFYLKSSVIPLENIDFEPELDSIREWKDREGMERHEEKIVKRVWDKLF